MARYLLPAVLGAACLGGVLAWSLRPAGPVPCEQRATVADRDICLYQEVVGAESTSAEAAQRTIQSIADPVVRSAAVVAWLDAHASTPLEDSEPLCDLLTGTERMACQRRVHSPHLRR